MRTFDIVLFGATGFTGSLVADYLVRHGSNVRLALAGRDRAKLEALSARLGKALPILVADAGVPATLAAIAAQTKVVCTTVGPYVRYGSGLVAACAAAGTDYCDLTGELHWVRRMIDAHHDTARGSGARIVHSCGFDSIPSDLGTHVLQAHAMATRSAPCSRVTYVVRKLRGGASGGTIASILDIARDALRDPVTRAILLDAYSLNPEGERRGPDSKRLPRVHRDADAEAWTAPFVMGAINERVVRRTNALSGYPYGRDFAYHEVVAFPGKLGFVKAAGVAAGLGLFFVGAALSPVRALLERTVLPSPGQGPSQQARDAGFFEIALVGHGVGVGGQPFAVRTRVAAKGDPGYAATARMLGESALCLAVDARSSEGGILTPAVAMGDRLVSRLRRAGITFDARTAI